MAGRKHGQGGFLLHLRGKRLGLLFELVPAARTFGILINPPPSSS
jgi:hypothetical protein